jgi:IS30 family transposase
MDRPDCRQLGSYVLSRPFVAAWLVPRSRRGSNENTNGLLRQYLPKKADLSCYSHSDLDEIALRLNQRPRKTWGFQTPAERLQASVVSTP